MIKCFTCNNRMKLFLIAFTIIISGLFSTFFASTDTTIINTSFENSGTPSYSPGNINAQNLWSVVAGSGQVVNDTAYLNNGSQGLKLSASSTALTVQHTAFNGSTSGITGIVYFDMYLKINSSATKEFTINGYDLFGGSIKRTFVVDFSIPANDTGSIRIYNGSNKVMLQKYYLNRWYRITGKVDYTNAAYQVCIDAGIPVSANFRETYTPTASGTRQATVKEYHQLLFNLGAAANVGSVDAAVDQIYVGSAQPSGVNFGASQFTVTLNQPIAGTILLNPSGGNYNSGTSVIATLSLPAGYLNYGWTGALTGTSLVDTFTVSGNMIIGATVWIDSLNPPVLYNLNVTQPQNALIDISPYYPQAYAGLKDTAFLNLQPGYILLNWTGDLTGNQVTKVFTVNSDMSFGANISLDTTTIPPGTRKTFSSAASFKTALLTAVPGDTIELVNGVYNLGGVSIAKSGTAQNPIIIRAQNVGQTELNGTSYFDLKQVNYVTIDGFLFTSGDVGSAIKTESCNYCRICRNTFALTSTISNKWVYIGGTYNLPLPYSSHNRIDHNIFQEKHTLGNFITFDGSPNPTSYQSQYDVVDHNYFRNIGPRAVNEMESIRVGVSTMCKSSGFTTIEYNLFDNCDGDPEIVSIKSCDDTVRYNTFRSCMGSVSLRSTNRSTVQGNFIFGNKKDGTGGIRVYGMDHKIYNNYMQDLTGSIYDAALTIMNGNIDSTSTSLVDHPQIVRAIYTNNTMINNAHNIEIGYDHGGDYNKTPANVILANNIVVGSQNELVKYYTTPSNMTFLSNIMLPSDSAVLGTIAPYSQIKVIDPQLTFSDSLWRLTAGSPAIDSESGNFDFVVKDVDGQTRTGLKDIGADEYSASTIITRPLGPNDVGPYAVDFVLPVELTSFNSIVSGNSVTLKWTTITESNCNNFTITRNGVKVTSLPGHGNSNSPQVYSWTDQKMNAGTYSYSLIQYDNNGKSYLKGTVEVNINLPVKYSLSQNYPNPFNPSTKIDFSIPKSANVELKIYNVLGQEVKSLVNGFMNAGFHSVLFDASPFSSGIYFYKMKTDSYVDTKKMILIK